MAMTNVPPELLAKLDRELKGKNFTQYSELTDWLNSMLAEAGLEVQVSRSAVYRYGKKLQTLLENVKRSSEMARAIASVYADDEGEINTATIRIAQDKLFTLLVDAEELTPKDLGNLARAIATLADSDTRVKKYREEVRQKLEQKFAELQPRKEIDKDTLALVMREIYGIV